MPSRRRLAATSPTHLKGPPSRVQKNRRPSPTKTPRLRQARSLATAAATQPFLQPLPTKELNARPQTRAQKRRCTDGDEHLQKRRRRTVLPLPTAQVEASRELVDTSKTPQQNLGRKGPRKDRRFCARVPETRSIKQARKAAEEPSVEQRQEFDTISRLSEGNLRKLESQLKEPKDMEPAVTPADRARKRGTVTRQPSLSDLNPETVTASARSQKSAGSLKFYRYEILEQARVHVRCEYPPPDVQRSLDLIFKREVSASRRVEIAHIAKETAQKFSGKTLGAAREDDLLELLNRAFDELFPNGKFNCPRKTDWNPELKPKILQDDVWNLDALGQASKETDEIIERPSKRQQADQTFPSPTTSQPSSQQIATPPQPKQDGAVKSPRPDTTIGFQSSAIINALIGLGLSKRKSEDLLRVLQLQRKLCSDPTTDYSNVRFPIQVVEGKAYATGKPMFEAENQAVVSGACMVNLQQQLIDLYEGIFPASEKCRVPLAFSVCTEGPLIQYWVNHCSMEEGVRTYYMSLLCVCNGALHDTLEVFLTKWEQLMGWYGDVFLKEYDLPFAYISSSPWREDLQGGKAVLVIFGKRRREERLRVEDIKIGRGGATTVDGLLVDVRGCLSMY
ncbi:MAG: hypothetical protein Q9170_005338 [Blastenia crenularia]